MMKEINSHGTVFYFTCFKKMRFKGSGTNVKPIS